MTDGTRVRLATGTHGPDLPQELRNLVHQLSMPLSNKVAVQGKSFVLPTGETSTGPIHAVILDFVWVLAHYPTEWNETDPGEPECWAIGRDTPESGKLLPHEGIETPKAKSCAECPMNKWGSGRGKAKRCKNSRRLAIVPPEPSADATNATLYVSPSGLKAFDSYVGDLAAQHGLLPFQVVTRIAFDPRTSYPTLTFKFDRVHELSGSILGIRTRAQQALWKPINLGTGASGAGVTE